MSPFLQIIFLAIAYLTVVFLHMAKKNTTVAMLYAVQSFAIVSLLIGSAFVSGQLSLLLVALCTFLVKVVMAPRFFFQLIKKNELRFTASTYLNTPLSLIAVALLTAAVNMQAFSAFFLIAPDHKNLLALSLAIMLISLFLMINRRGALSQIIGILSLENGIVAFALFSGLEQSFAFQLGILFDIIVWLIIATIFVSMVYKHFGSLDVTTMHDLKE